nr:MAG TPA: hypothetical protein [Caudoviricetes sp.]DAH46983.1 MAG TPA: hypothetical protein [Caudoviricetes sp.]
MQRCLASSESSSSVSLILKPRMWKRTLPDVGFITMPLP